MRDLGSAEPWQESLERSRARRGESRGSGSPRPRAPRPQAPRSPAPGPQAPRPQRARRLPLPGVAAGTVGVALALVVISGGLVGGRGASASADSGRSAAHHRGVVIGTQAAFARDTESAARTCQPAPASAGYVNPLAHAAVRGERIDQGVDYAGRGVLTALGAARVTYVGTSNTGWPGAFIEYRLLSGPDSGCFVYYAEGIQPAPTLHIGQTVQPGEQLATIIPGWSTGIELGWAAGRSTVTYAAKMGGWTPTDDADSVASEAGRSFSMLISDLGGPAGRVES